MELATKSVEAETTPAYKSNSDFVNSQNYAALSAFQNLSSIVGTDTQALIFDTISSAMKKDCEFNDFLQKKAVSLLETSLAKSCADRKVLNIPVTLKITEQDRLKSLYPSFQLNFIDSTPEPHSYAHAQRIIEYYVCLKYAGYVHSKNKKKIRTHEFHIKDVGCNATLILGAGLQDICGCAPILSIKDSMRKATRQNFIQNFSPRYDSQKRVVQDMQRCYAEGHSLFCEHKAQDCYRTAKTCLFIHSTYDMLSHNIADIMQSANSVDAYGTFIWTPKILFEDRVFLKELNCHMSLEYMDCVVSEDVEKHHSKITKLLRKHRGSRLPDFKKNKRLCVVFNFPNDSSGTYVHDAVTYFDFVMSQYIVSTDGTCHYGVEFMVNVSGIQYFKILRLEHTVSPASFMVRPFTISDNEMLYIKHYRWVHSETIKNCMVPVYFSVPAQLWDHVYSFTYGLLDGKFIVQSAIAAANSFNNRTIVGGVSVGTREKIGAREATLLAFAVYLRVWKDKYDDGHVLKELQKDEQNVRDLTNASCWSQFLMRIRSIKTGIFSNLDPDIKSMICLHLYRKDLESRNLYKFNIPNPVDVQFLHVSQYVAESFSVRFRDNRCEQDSIELYDLSNVVSKLVGYRETPEVDEPQPSPIVEIQSSIRRPPNFDFNLLIPTTCDAKLTRKFNPGDGKCCYYALMHASEISMSVDDLKKRLLGSKHFSRYSDELQSELKTMLTTDVWGDTTIIHLFCMEFGFTACVHSNESCYAIENNAAKKKIHILHKNNHFEALMPTNAQYRIVDLSEIKISSDDIDEELKKNSDYYNSQLMVLNSNDYSRRSREQAINRANVTKNFPKVFSKFNSFYRLAEFTKYHNCDWNDLDILIFGSAPGGFSQLIYSRFKPHSVLSVSRPDQKFEAQLIDPYATHEIFQDPSLDLKTFETLDSLASTIDIRSVEYQLIIIDLFEKDVNVTDHIEKINNCLRLVNEGQCETNSNLLLVIREVAEQPMQQLILHLSTLYSKTSFVMPSISDPGSEEIFIYFESKIADFDKDSVTFDADESVKHMLASAVRCVTVSLGEIIGQMNKPVDYGYTAKQNMEYHNFITSDLQLSGAGLVELKYVIPSLLMRSRMRLNSSRLSSRSSSTDTLSTCITTVEPTESFAKPVGYDRDVKTLEKNSFLTQQKPEPIVVRYPERPFVHRVKSFVNKDSDRFRRNNVCAICSYIFPSFYSTDGLFTCPRRCKVMVFYNGGIFDFQYVYKNLHDKYIVNFLKLNPTVKVDGHLQQERQFTISEVELQPEPAGTREINATDSTCAIISRDTTVSEVVNTLDSDSIASPLRQEYSLNPVVPMNSTLQEKLTVSANEQLTIWQRAFEALVVNLKEAWNFTVTGFLDGRLRDDTIGILTRWHPGSVSVKYCNKWILKNFQDDVDFQYCYTSGGLKPYTKTKNELLIVHKDLETFLDDQFYNKFSTHCLDINADLNINFIQGVPGCGKSHYIVENYKLGDLVLAATKEACNQLRERIKEKNKSVLDTDIRTVASFMLHVKHKYQRVWVDEARMLHVGSIAFIASMTNATTINCLGDALQIPYVCRVEFVAQHYDLAKIVPASTVLDISRRCPLDIAALFHDNYKKHQGKGMLSTSSIRNSRRLVMIANSLEIPFEERAIYITFLQEEKQQLKVQFQKYRLNKKKEYVYTVHEYQGNQSPYINIVRLNTKKDMGIFKREEYVLVALTRHTRLVTYYTPVDSDLIAEKIQMQFTDSALQAVYSQPTLGGGGDDYSYLMLPQDERYLSVSSENIVYVTSSIIDLPHDLPIAVTYSTVGQSAKITDSLFRIYNIQKKLIVAKCGEVLKIVGRKGKTFYVLVVNDENLMRPTYQLFKTLIVKLSLYLMQDGISKIHMPRIGVNENLEWAVVSSIISLNVGNDITAIIHDVNSFSCVKDVTSIDASMLNTEPTVSNLQVKCIDNIDANYPEYNSSDFFLNCKLRIKNNEYDESDKEFIHDIGLSLSRNDNFLFYSLSKKTGIELDIKDQEATLRVMDSFFSVNDTYNVIKLMQFVYDQALPGNSSYTVTSDTMIVHSSDLDIMCDSFYVDSGKIRQPVSSRYDPMKSVLSTCIRPSRPRSSIEMILGANKRNMAVFPTSQMVNYERLVKFVINQFKSIVPDKKKHLLGDYRNNMLTSDPITIREWLDTQPTNVVSLLKNKSVYDIPWNVYDFDIKTSEKPILDGTAPHTYPALQTIVSTTKDLNVFLCGMFKEAKRRFLALLPDNFHTFTDLSPEAFADMLNIRQGMPPEDISSLEIDISKFDKSHFLYHLLIDCEIMKLLGFPDNVVSLWFWGHAYTVAMHKSLSLRFTFLFQRKSGDPSTWLFNTANLIMAVNSLYDLKKCYMCLFSGDDSLILYQGTMPDLTEECSRFFNFQSKFFFGYKYYSFCSKFLFYENNSWHMVPDLIKFIAKLGRQDLMNKYHVELYRISCVDLLKEYNKSVVQIKLADCINDRYGTNFNDFGFLLNQLQRIVRVPRHFRSLFYHEPHANISNNRFLALPDL